MIETCECLYRGSLCGAIVVHGADGRVYDIETGRPHSCHIYALRRTTPPTA